jgi:AP-1 complex subunit beta-1
MGCLRVFDLCPYLIEPLSKALVDKDAYVQKNAVMCVPKVYELAPKLIEDNKLVDILIKILETNENGLVISNTIIALSEINSIR